MFSFKGRKRPPSMGTLKVCLDVALGEDLRAWTRHDLRPAMATALADAGSLESVVDRSLNQAAPGSAPSAVARIYQQGDSLPERARALESNASMACRRSVRRAACAPRCLPAGDRRTGRGQTIAPFT